MRIFKEAFGDNVWAMSSKWKDEQSTGLWLICGAEDSFVND
jgi:hypothetical protein